MQQLPATPAHDLDSGPTADAEGCLRALAGISISLSEIYDALAVEDLDPVQAALAVHLTERIARLTACGQLVVAANANDSRVMGLDAGTVHAVEVIAADPAPFAEGKTDAPSAPTAKTTGKLLFRDTADYYRERLCVGGAETSRRLSGARLLLSRRDQTAGTPGAPRYPLLAAAARDGSADVFQLVNFARRLETLQSSIDQRRDATVVTAEIEASLAEASRTQEASGGKKILKAWEEYLDASDTPPSAAELRARQGVFYLREHRGLHELLLRCTSLQYEALETFFDAADNQRSTKAATFRGGDGAQRPHAGTPESPADNATRTDQRRALFPSIEDVDQDEPMTSSAWQPNEDRAPAWACDPELPADQRPLGDFPTRESIPPQDDPADGRTRAQRRLDYLATGCANTFNSSGVAGSALNAQVVVHIDYQTLLGQLDRSGYTQHGITVDAQNIRQLACQAKILPIVFGGDNEVLNIGRQSRYFTRAQRDAVLARQGGGCFRPGCTMPAHTLQLHHLQYWSEGGETSVENALGSCDHDHHLLHTGDLKVVMINGVPYLASDDPEAPPQRNTYWNPRDAVTDAGDPRSEQRMAPPSLSPPAGPCS